MAGQELKGKVKRILFWRWSHQLSGTDELDHTQSPQKKAAAQAAEVEQKEKEAHGATVSCFFCYYNFDYLFHTVVASTQFKNCFCCVIILSLYLI